MRSILFQMIWEFKINNNKFFGTFPIRNWIHTFWLDEVVEKPLLLNMDTGEVERELEFSLLFHHVFNNDIIVTKSNDAKIRYGIRLTDFATIWSIDSKLLSVGAVYDGNLVYCKFSDNPNVLACLDVTAGTIKWQKEITNPDGEIEERHKRIQKILGLYKDKLYIVNYASRIMELRASDGEMTGYWSDLQGITWRITNTMEYDALPAPTNTILAPDEAKIFGLSWYFFWEVDLETKDISFFDLTKEFKAAKVSVNVTGKLTRQGERLFFTSSYSEKNEQNVWVKYYSIGAFNTKTRQIEWTHPFDFTGVNGFASPAPIVEEDRLYVMDTQGTLHIFSKETATVPG